MVSSTRKLHQERKFEIIQTMELTNGPLTLTLTDAAHERIVEALAEERKPFLRMYVQGGGCSGFSYGFALEDTKAEDDFELNTSNVAIVVDNMSAGYITGSTLDFQDEMWERKFVINNPNATSTCGCGSSFSA